VAARQRRLTDAEHCVQPLDVFADSFRNTAFSGSDSVPLLDPKKGNSPFGVIEGGSLSP
jgi:hypothetical protein